MGKKAVRVVLILIAAAFAVAVLAGMAAAAPEEPISGPVTTVVEVREPIAE